MSYSESGPDSNFAISSALNFYSFSESNSESEPNFSSVFMNLDICVFLPYIYTLLLSDLHSFLVNVYLPVCKMFLHFKSIFENIYL